jgi:hypothetical protein
MSVWCCNTFPQINSCEKYCCSIGTDAVTGNVERFPVDPSFHHHRVDGTRVSIYHGTEAEVVLGNLASRAGDHHGRRQVRRDRTGRSQILPRKCEPFDSLRVQFVILGRVLPRLREGWCDRKQIPGLCRSGFTYCPPTGADSRARCTLRDNSQIIYGTGIFLATMFG